MFYELAEYGKTLLSTMPKNYENAQVHYIIDIDSQTQKHQYIPTAYIEIVEKKGKQEKKTKYKRYNVPTVVRTGKAIKPRFYCDNGQYIFGMKKKKDDKVPQNVIDRHDSYIKLTRRLVRLLHSKYAVVIYNFMSENNEPPEGAKDSDLFMFAIDGKPLVDIPEVQDLWAKEHTQKITTESHCVICGEMTEARKNIPAQAVVNGSKCLLFAIGKQAFESYKKTAANNIVVCDVCEKNAVKAINFLSTNKLNHLTMMSEMYIFWAKNNIKSDAMSFLATPQPSAINKLIKSVYSGNNDAVKLNYTPFFMLSMRPKKNRVAITSTIYTSLEKVQKNIASFFRSQRLGDVYYGILTLAGAMVLKLNQLETNTTIISSLFQYAVEGKKLPFWIACKVLERIEAEQKITRPKIALINAWLVSNKEINMEEKIGLDENKTNIGYLCGRLLAELDNAQRVSISGINSSIGERYYKVASARPSKTFPRLIEGAINHLAGNNPAQKAIGKRINEIMIKIQDVPQKLNCAEKMFFALGYFHQQDKNIKNAIENKQKKEMEKKND